MYSDTSERVGKRYTSGVFAIPSGVVSKAQARASTTGKPTPKENGEEIALPLDWT